MRKPAAILLVALAGIGAYTLLSSFNIILTMIDERRMWGKALREDWDRTGSRENAEAGPGLTHVSV